ncbi:pimeloyl-ACP methyl ester carboxylesterase [Parvibaculum indicum]|uniref:nucleotidyl transferase AbiEii/AbiGii toxin family protein n=1 Tax=Parvibaculum indicum TaxID=562969 RepID=UPI0014237D3D|nr:nucleotidyl transferase AbiEii/AbiGii toxin family protein [Parvibaculum indicum]NIJ41749.1 pimeloyl-ACP methyl ester carboxylesterase [Parvibaculum indicum]
MIGSAAASRWDELFRIAVSIIDQAGARAFALEGWSFGGGTALMLHLSHRESHDVDIFLPDRQFLPLLNPVTQEYDVAIAPSGYQTDGSGSLKIVFGDIGEIDFICSPSLTPDPVEWRDIEGRRVALERPAEIIAKKLVYRGTRMQPRDMFDIAAISQAMGESHLIDRLKPFRPACEAALETARRVDPDFARSLMSDLMIRDGFSDLPQHARAMTIDLLEKVSAS